MRQLIPAPPEVNARAITVLSSALAASVHVGMVCSIETGRSGCAEQETKQS
jgi:hypothetical protein